MASKTYPINCKLLKKLIRYKRNDEKSTKSESGLGISFSDNIEDRLKEYQESAERQKKFEEDTKEFTDTEFLHLFAFYHYGRDECKFLEVTPPTTTSSYNDIFNDFKDWERDDIIIRLRGLQYSAIKKYFKDALRGYFINEKGVQERKDKHEKRLKSFNKKTISEIEKYKENTSNSTIQTFKDIFSDYQTETIKDIKRAKEIIERIIHSTGGQIVCDFIDYGNFDHLHYVEIDETHNILKLYWHHSNVKSTVQNVRVDLKFDSLLLINEASSASIAIKGYYQTLKEVRNYYGNAESVNKFIQKPKTHSHSNFQYEMSFDKRVNKKTENFHVSVLPWRFYNVLISPKENLGDVIQSKRILIMSNLKELENRIDSTYEKIQLIGLDNEDDITMFGNRYRKFVENLLKLICLMKAYMFEENYKSDTLGNLLTKLKENSLYFKLENGEDVNITKVNVEPEILLFKIITLTENIIKELNLHSHENVCTKIDETMLENLNKETNVLLKTVYLYLMDKNILEHLKS
ncbi:hypothetical protein LXN10_13975 [Arcobacter sp. KX21116]|uniref:hypothetical protein n=1 Tax=Arcobacter iocasae TaxID=2906515 RepID=UPI0035D4427C